jgi:hypothetical protein
METRKQVIPTIFIFSILFLLLHCREQRSSGEHVIAWTGTDIPTCQFYVDGKFIGTGELGFRQMVYSIEKLHPVKLEIQTPEDVTLKQLDKYDRLTYFPYMERYDLDKEFQRVTLIDRPTITMTHHDLKKCN